MEFVRLGVMKPFNLATYGDLLVGGHQQLVDWLEEAGISIFYQGFSKWKLGE